MTAVESTPARFQSYSEAFATLEQVARRLARGGPADIDRLVEDLALAKAAYEFCAEKIRLTSALIDQLAGPDGANGARIQ